MHPYKSYHSGSRLIPHFIGGEWIKEGGPFSANSPYTGELMFEMSEAGPQIVFDAVKKAHIASLSWGRTPLKERTRILFNAREEILKNIKELSATISFESGKTLGEAEAGLMKGLEVLEFATSLQNSDMGGKIEVSRGVHCEFRREALGVVAGITPFNFPAMVPMWMMPIAIALGNAFIWKPSEKVPMTSELLGKCWEKAGLPKGVLTILQGGANTVNALIDHPDVRAIGFVGSTPVAKAIYTRGSALGKRVLALGGAKNHIILMPDADPEIAAQGIADSFTGCAGQRCMAASVLLAVGDVSHIIKKIAEKASQLSVGETMGAIITKKQTEFLSEAIARAEKAGAKLLLDGRKAKPLAGYENGNWLAPTILDQVQPGTEAATQELFGPIMSVIHVKTLDEALAIDQESEFGNATSVFTQNGAIAEEVAARSQSGMIGINIGVPVPREPFSFGGTHDSKFGHGEITGPGSLNFWSDLKKITTKWTLNKDKNWMN
jgi:malonate-semialdehyde dehydrogenase (acetylating)/methylmalonate-semialdehyde dehydrogenase